MRLTLLNLTQEDISCYLNDKRNSDLEITLSSSCPSLTLDLSDNWKSITLFRTDPLSSKSNASVSKEGSFNPNGVVIQLSLARSARWRMIPLHNQCSWRIYLSRVCSSSGSIIHIRPSCCRLPLRILDYTSYLDEIYHHFYRICLTLYLCRLSVFQVRNDL